MPTPDLSQIRAAAGRKGGSASSERKKEAARRNAATGGQRTTERKREAARINGKKGGRPKRKATAVFCPSGESAPSLDDGAGAHNGSPP